MDTTTTPAEQFAEDYLLVVENDYEAYSEMMGYICETDSVAELSDRLRNEYEALTEAVTAIMENRFSPVAVMLISQLLNYWGSTPFDIIARRVMEQKKEATNA